MYPLVLFVATAALGIDVGWQRLPEGGMQYIIQIEPQALESLRSGAEFGSDIPPKAGEIRSFRIFMGKKTLPRDEPPPKLSEPKAAERTPPRTWPGSDSLNCCADDGGYIRAAIPMPAPELAAGSRTLPPPAIHPAVYC